MPNTWHDFLMVVPGTLYHRNMRDQKTPKIKTNIVLSWLQLCELCLAPWSKQAGWSCSRVYTYAVWAGKVFREKRENETNASYCCSLNAASGWAGPHWRLTVLINIPWVFIATWLLSRRAPTQHPHTHTYEAFCTPRSIHISLCVCNISNKSKWING